MKAKRGRQAHQPTPQTKRQVELMAGFGNTEDEISRILGVSKPTLRLHYAEELETGHIKATNAVAANLFKQATKDDPKSVQAAQFWLRCRAGWSEYAPPQKPKLDPVGKKEQAEIDALAAHEGNEWGDLVRH